MLMSQLLTPGPWKKRRGEFPSWPSGSKLKSEVLKYGCPERGFVKFSGPPLYSGESYGSWIGPEPDVPSSDRSSVSSSVTGRPVEKRVIPLTLHPCVSRLEANLSIGSR